MRPMMDQGGCTGKAACRSGSGVERRVRPARTSAAQRAPSEQRTPKTWPWWAPGARGSPRNCGKSLYAALLRRGTAVEDKLVADLRASPRHALGRDLARRQWNAGLAEASGQVDKPRRPGEACRPMGSVLPSEA